MKIVKVKDKRRFGIKTITEVGSIQPSATDGTFQLEDSAAKILVEGDSSFCYADEHVEEIKKPEQIKPKSESVQVFDDLDQEELAELQQLQKEQELQKTQLQPTSILDQIQKAAEQEPIEEATETSGDEEESEDIKAYRAVLSSKNKTELIDLAKQFPGGEWRALVKEDLIEYLIAKTK